MQDELDCVNRLVEQMRAGRVPSDRLDVPAADRPPANTAILLMGLSVVRETQKGRSQRHDVGSGPA